MTLGLMGVGQVIFKVLLNATDANKMLHFRGGGVIGQWLSLNQVGFGFCGSNPGSLSDMEDGSAGHSLSLPFL